MSVSEPEKPAPATVRRVLAIATMAVFAGGIFLRSVDPMIPRIAADLATEPNRVALLATAFALPYALVQPILGAFADIFGKTRLMTISLVALLITAVGSAAAPDFTTLLTLRIFSGIFAGGVFPVSLAITADLVPVHQRQVAIGRLLSAAMLGNLLGSPGAGVVADLVGWRGGFVVMAVIALVAVGAALFGFRGVATRTGTRADIAALPATYRSIFKHPLAKICFGAVLVEAICLFGVFPYIALLLERGGEPRASIAGIIIAGFGLGGLVYAIAVGRLLARFGEQRLMAAGGLIMGLSMMVIAQRLPWQIELLMFVALGLGFYLLHGVIQIYVTELVPVARGATTSLHSSFFFLGHAIGPLVYATGFASIGVTATLVIAGAVLIALGLFCANRLRRRTDAMCPDAPG